MDGQLQSGNPKILEALQRMANPGESRGEKAITSTQKTP